MPQLDPVVPFVPVSRQLLDSSLWEQNATVCKLWVTLLFVASEPGRRGTVDITLRSLAARAKLTVEETVEALAVLMAPDPDSRSREHEGRRVERLDEHRAWGWRILNWGAYEEQRERMLHAARQARYRAAQRHAPSRFHTRDVEGEVEVEVEKEKESEREGEGRRPRRAEPRKAPTLSQVSRLWEEEHLRGGAEKFFRFHAARGWRGVEDWREAARYWSLDERRSPTDPDPDAVPWGANRPRELDEETRPEE